MAQANVVSTNFRFNVSKIKDLDVIWTPEIMVQGIPWKVKVYKGVIEGEASLAVYLTCVKDDESPNWSHAASASFKLLSFAGNQNEIEEDVDPYVFDKSENYFGCGSLISWNDLFDKEKSYVRNDAINLEIEIKAADPNEATKSNLVCTTIEKCCDEGCLATFRLTVTNMKQLMAVRSPQLILRNTAWYLTVFKDSYGYIDIRLESVNAPDDFSCKVRMICKLISTKKKPTNIEQTNEEILERLDTISTTYFVSWDELMKPLNGYVNNGSMVIEVELKVDKPEGSTPYNDSTDSEGEEKLLKIECAICFEGFRSKEVSSIKCGHMFCTACITEAIETRKKCPKCNKPATVKDVRRIYIDNLN